MVISKIQVSDPGPSWPSCLCYLSVVCASVHSSMLIHFLLSDSPNVIKIYTYILNNNLQIHVFIFSLLNALSSKKKGLHVKEAGGGFQ